MKSTSHSHKHGVDYESGEWHESRTHAGVRFRTVKMSLNRRAGLIGRVKDLAEQARFFAAGRSEGERLETAALEARMQRMYLEWGLEALEGLTIDGAAASVELLVERGPEELCGEIAAAVRRSCGLSEEERKN